MFTLTSQDRHGILQMDMFGEKIENEIIELGNMPEKWNDATTKVYSRDGISPTLTTMQGGNQQPKILETNELLRIGNIDAPGWADMSTRVYDENGIARTLMASGESNSDKTGLYLIKYRIRKLTPKECWRLQGFKDADFEKAAKVNSNSQLYKQAGNSISVNVPMEIYKILFKDYIKEVQHEYKYQVI